MQTEEISFVNDVIQDNRADSRLEHSYDLLISHIFKNCKLNWDKEGLILKSDEKLFNLLELLEPKLYGDKLKELQNLENNKKEE